MKAYQKCIIYKKCNLFEYGTSKFNKRVNLNKKGKLQTNFDTKFPTSNLGELVEIIKRCKL